MIRQVHTQRVGQPSHVVARKFGKWLRRVSQAAIARASTNHEATGRGIRALRCQVHAVRPGTNTARP